MSAELTQHVLLAEDSRTQAMRARLVLEEAGYRVTVAPDGLTAWDRLAAEPFTIVVSDINMPGIDGYELCRRAKADARLKRTPFVLLTSHDEYSALVRGVEVGVDDFILKPWLPSALLDRIATVLRVNAEGTSEGGAASIERMSRLVMARTNELEAAHRDSDKQRVQLRILNQDLEASVLQLKSANVQLATATKHKSDFLSKMSHELRTPLTAILGFADLLLDPARDDDASKREAFLRQIRTAGDHLLSLVNDLLDLARVEAGTMEIKRERLSLKTVVEDSASVIEGMAQLKGIKVTLVLPSADPVVVGDPRRLKQVVFNLLSNAVKFTQPNGRVTLGLEAVEGFARVWVEDDGPGIEPADQARIFKEFEQVRGTTSEFPGTGLGLALSLAIVESHAGTISVHSEVGKGSTFEVKIPLVAVEAVV